MAYIYIYIYIYIDIHRQFVSLYHISSVRQDTQDVSNWDWNPPNFTLDLVSYHSANSGYTTLKASSNAKAYVNKFLLVSQQQLSMGG